MSNVKVTEVNFKMTKKNLDKFEKALEKMLVDDDPAVCRGCGKINGIPTLDDIYIYGDVTYDDDGNVINITFNEDAYHRADEGFWEIIAPFVEEGSYFQLEEEGTIWRMVFHDKKFVQVDPIITWPKL